MNRLTVKLDALKEQNKKALVTYIVSGDPSKESTVDAMHALVASGADVIEIGVPFSDPMAEGIVIQKAHERALEKRTSLSSTLDEVAKFRATNQDTPVVLMGYANPVERMGYELFVAAAKKAGVDALLTVDLPPEESAELDQLLLDQDIQTIYLLAPTSANQRIEKICEAARGFVYYVSVKGVTGSNPLDADEVARKVAAIREHAKTPVLVGFGIKDATSAAAIAAVSDGVIVGSVLVSILAQTDKDLTEKITEMSSLVQSMRNALDEL